MGGSKGLRLGAYPKAPYWKIVKGGQFGGLAWALGCSFYSLVKKKFEGVGTFGLGERTLVKQRPGIPVLLYLLR